MEYALEILICERSKLMESIRIINHFSCYPEYNKPETDFLSNLKSIEDAINFLSKEYDEQKT